MTLCIGFFFGSVAYGLAFFLPTIISELGFSATHTQLLSVAPFATGFVCEYILFLLLRVINSILPIIGTKLVSYLSDKYQTRAIPICFCAVISAIGYIIFLGSSSGNVFRNLDRLITDSVSRSIAMSYGSLFLSVCGIYSLLPISAAWIANNSEPHYRRATSLALSVMATSSVTNFSSSLSPPSKFDWPWLTGRYFKYMAFPFFGGPSLHSDGENIHHLVRASHYWLLVYSDIIILSFLLYFI